MLPMTDEKLLTQTTATHTKTTVREEPKPSLLSSVLAIAGFIVLIIVVLWGLLNIATLSSPWLSSIFSKSAASIQVSAPANVTSGENFTVSWKYSTAEKGMYALLYQCRNNLRLETSGGNGTTNAVPCGAAFTVSPTGSAVVTPILSGIATTSLPISVIFIPNAITSTSSGQASSKQAQGNVTVVVHPGAAPVVVVPAPAQPTTPVAPAKPRATGPADLSVHIISVRVDPSGMGIAEFDIANDGASSSGMYYFEAYLPTQSGYPYSSPAQSSLAPGDHIVNTLRFSQATGGTVSITIDPSNSVHESNENNNYASQSLSMPYNAYPYQPAQYPYAY